MLIYTVLCLLMSRVLVCVAKPTLWRRTMSSGTVAIVDFTINDRALDALMHKVCEGVANKLPEILWPSAGLTRSPDWRRNVSSDADTCLIAEIALSSTAPSEHLHALRGVLHNSKALTETFRSYRRDDGFQGKSIWSIKIEISEGQRSAKITPASPDDAAHQIFACRKSTAWRRFVSHALAQFKELKLTIHTES